MNIIAKSLALGMSLAIAPISAFAQPSGTQSGMPSGQQGHGAMPMPGQMQNMMGGGRGMPGQGMMHMGMMGRGMPMRIMMILVDTNGDGVLSLEEVQTAHARMFKAVDADDSGTVTLEEMQAFMSGQPEQASR